MIHNRTACRQIDMTEEDLLILLGLRTPIEPRCSDRTDACIMRALTAAVRRGVKPAEIQRQVAKLDFPDAN